MKFKIKLEVLENLENFGNTTPSSLNLEGKYVVERSNEVNVLFNYLRLLKNFLEIYKKYFEDNTKEIIMLIGYIDYLETIIIEKLENQEKREIS